MRPGGVEKDRRHTHRCAGGNSFELQLKDVGSGIRHRRAAPSVLAQLDRQADQVSDTLNAELGFDDSAGVGNSFVGYTERDADCRQRLALAELAYDVHLTRGQPIERAVVGTPMCDQLDFDVVLDIAASGRHFLDRCDQLGCGRTLADIAARTGIERSCNVQRLAMHAEDQDFDGPLRTT
jgi:hypothetical protein